MESALAMAVATVVTAEVIITIHLEATAVLYPIFKIKSSWCSMNEIQYKLKCNYFFMQ